MIDIENRNIMMQLSNPGERKTRLVWKDEADISKKFLKKLDKINKYPKHKINCFFSQKSDFFSKPKLIVLRRLGGESTTWRIVLITLRALEWTGRIRLKVKNQAIIKDEN